jgi:hypothetical protein
MSQGDWDTVNLSELMGVAVMAAFTGIVRALYLIRRGRRFVWFDFILEPSLAVIGGLLVWALLEVTNSPDVLQLAMSWLGAWGGPRTINALERKYIGDRLSEASNLVDTKE